MPVLKTFHAVLLTLPQPECIVPILPGDELLALNGLPLEKNEAAIVKRLRECRDAESITITVRDPNLCTTKPHVHRAGQVVPTRHRAHQTTASQPASSNTRHQCNAPHPGHEQQRLLERTRSHSCSQQRRPLSDPQHLASHRSVLAALHINTTPRDGAVAGPTDQRSEDHARAIPRL
jgi:hypothetical protein